jgi:hypothetical protein
VRYWGLLEGLFGPLTAVVTSQASCENGKRSPLVAEFGMIGSILLGYTGVFIPKGNNQNPYTCWDKHMLDMTHLCLIGGVNCYIRVCGQAIMDGCRFYQIMLSRILSFGPGFKMLLQHIFIYTYNQTHNLLNNMSPDNSVSNTAAIFTYSLTMEKPLQGRFWSRWCSHMALVER